MPRNSNILHRLVSVQLGEAGATDVLGLLAIDPALEAGEEGVVSRAQFAFALNAVLFAGLLERVPTGAAYVADVRRQGGTICFDHGALRTVLLPDGEETGALPAGEGAFRRVLEPLGYRAAALYPLPALRMTGRAYRHLDLPETIPQFFLSELHVDRFDDAFVEAARRVFGSSRDPLTADARAALDGFERDGEVPLDLAMAALGPIASAFDRQHDAPSRSDYEALLARSAEAAWIATEGNAFNHATDRVPDVMALAEEQKALGRPMKEKVEVSGSGRVRQTAFRADPVERRFVRAGGGEEVLAVPGSFYEFITRDIDPATGMLDLSFDSGNATGIFKMTGAA